MLTCARSWFRARIKSFCLRDSGGCGQRGCVNGCTITVSSRSICWSSAGACSTDEYTSVAMRLLTHLNICCICGTLLLLYL